MMFYGHFKVYIHLWHVTIVVIINGFFSTLNPIRIKDICHDMDIVIMHIVTSIMILIVKLQNQPNTMFGQLGLVLWRGWQQ